MNFAGRSVVSAITHTPASGPFALATTPPMSSLSIATVTPPLCCAWTRVNEGDEVHEANKVVMTTTTANKPTLGLTRNFICSSAVQRTTFFFENKLGFLDCGEHTPNHLRASRFQARLLPKNRWRSSEIRLCRPKNSVGLGPACGC